MTEPDELPTDRLAYSPAELAAALGCSRQHVQNMIARGELRSIKLGRKRLIPVAVVADLLEAGAVTCKQLAADAGAEPVTAEGLDR